MRLLRAKTPLTPMARRLRLWLGGLCLAALLLGVIIYADVRHQGKPIYDTIAASPSAPVAIVLGAQGFVLQDRVDTGAALYKAGKVKKLLMTGDNHRDDYNEPEEMRRMALADGIPDQDIVLDYAGFRTYDSLYRARDIFGVRQALVVSQRYHLPRALYLGRRLGMNVVGVSATRRAYVGQSWFDVREVLAVEAAWLDIQTHRRPKFLGKREPIFKEGV